MPPIGLGTWDLKPDGVAVDAVLYALGAGYRLIDTAAMYGNEQAIGEAIRASSIPRKEITVVTKVWNDDQGYERTLQACQRSLAKLGLDYIDVYLIHWPASTRRHDSWRAMEKMYKDGLIKAAGVSNYTIDHLEELRERSDLLPAVNQVEFHPYIFEQQVDLLDYCQQLGIVVQAYSPLSRLQHRPSNAIKALAARHHRTPQQVFIRWSIEHGTVPLPRSSRADHIDSNFEVFDFELDKYDMEILNSLSTGSRVTWDPAGMGQYHHAT